MEQKYYAIKYPSGKKTRLEFGTWDSVKHLVIGKKGMAFKGFSSKAQAKAWLATERIPQRQSNTPHKKDQLYVYVDGSFSSKRKASGWGYVAVKNDIIIQEDWGVIYSDHIESRNIAGELKATIEAVKWLRSNGLKAIIVHDYAGIALWALKMWKARKPVVKAYLREIEDYVPNLKWEKCSGHSNVKWNDVADELTRRYQLNETG